MAHDVSNEPLGLTIGLLAVTPSWGSTALLIHTVHSPDTSYVPQKSICSTYMPMPDNAATESRYPV